MGADRLRQLLPKDPELAALRRAMRVALVMPAVFIVAKLVIGDIQTLTFAAFGCFSLIVLADFGGPRRSRAGAYLMTIAVGLLLITLGTLASPSVWVGVLAMLLVGFSIQFAGVFGGYVVAAQTALQLSFLLAVSVPAPPSAIGARLMGYVIAGLVSTLAGVFLWPRFEQLALYAEAADACRALAAFVGVRRARPDATDRTPLGTAARAAVERVRRDYAAMPKRPAGPTRRDRAFVELLSALDPALEFATRPLGGDDAGPTPLPARPQLPEGDTLVASTVEVLVGSADVLTGGAPPDILALYRARLAHRRALDRWAVEALAGGTPPEDVLASLDVDHWLRVVAYLALGIGSNAVLAAGKQLSGKLQLPVGTPREGRTRPLIRVVRIIRTHLAPTSSVLHQALRVGIGLAVAVFLARTLALQHGFWAVLGTLSVLRSNAFATGRTTVAALIGTVAGFAVGALFMVMVGATSSVLWVALPIAVFFAAYASGAIGFVVGQAAFTMLVIILFNVISPVGWRVGLVRIEDVALGVGISAAVGLLLWPRGARAELVASVADEYRAVAGFLAGCFARVLGDVSSGDVTQTRRPAVQARDRASEAFDLFLYERGPSPLPSETAAFLVDAGTRAILAGDLLIQVADTGYQTLAASDVARTLRDQSEVVVAGFRRLADRLDGGSSPLQSDAHVSEDMLRHAALSSLRHWQGDSGRDRTAVAAVIAGEWIQQLGELAAALEVPVGEAVEAARLPWWR